MLSYISGKHVYIIKKIIYIGKMGIDIAEKQFAGVKCGLTEGKWGILRILEMGRGKMVSYGYNGEVARGDFISKVC